MTFRKYKTESSSCKISWSCAILNLVVACVFLWSSAVPEGVAVEKPVFAAHWEAALVPPLLLSDCALSLPTTL